MMKHLFSIPLLTTVLLMAACSNAPEDTTNMPDVNAILKNDSSIETNLVAIPSPDEMFSFMKGIQGNGKSTTHLNDINHYNIYINTKAKALNFGIYAADFLYCSTFDYTIEAVKYFTIIRKLGDDLGIGAVMSQSAAERIKNNVGKNDSLTSISNSVYFASVAELEKTDKASTLALVMAGGWVESMYLTTKMMAGYPVNHPAMVRLAEQKYTLNNLLTYLSKYELEYNVAEVITPLTELNALYEELEEEQTKNSLSTKNGKKILSGGSKVLMTQEQYTQICEKITTIRNEFTSGK